MLHHKVSSPFSNTAHNLPTVHRVFLYSPEVDETRRKDSLQKGVSHEVNAVNTNEGWKGYTRMVNLNEKTLQEQLQKGGLDQLAGPGERIVLSAPIQKANETLNRREDPERYRVQDASAGTSWTR